MHLHELRQNPVCVHSAAAEPLEHTRGRDRGPPAGGNMGDAQQPGPGPGGGGGGGGGGGEPSMYSPMGAYLKRSTGAIIGSSKINVLLLFTPLAFAAKIMEMEDMVTFNLSLCALIPLAALLGYTTEELATYTNQTLGGLMNATVRTTPPPKPSESFRPNALLGRSAQRAPACGSAHRFAEPRPSRSLSPRCPPYI